MAQIFDFCINMLQSFLVTYFLIKSLGVKKSDEAPAIEYVVGITITFVYLEILSKITSFESIGIFVYLLVSMTFSIVLLNGSFIEKFFYNLLMIAGLAFSSLIAGGLVGLFYGADFFNVYLENSILRYIAVLLTQIILCIFFETFIKIKRILKYSDKKYIAVLSVIPVISVIVCCLILYKKSQPYMLEVTYTVIAIIGIVLINLICLVLLVIEHKTYAEKIEEQVQLSAYMQKEKDIDAIKNLKVETDKNRHEMSRTLMLLLEMLENSQSEQAKEYLRQFISIRNISDNGKIYCDNIVLNYLLNRKIDFCKENGIRIGCFINGLIDGIEDVDIYILFENLMDNAIEACIGLEKKKIVLNIYADTKDMSIEIGNTILKGRQPIHQNMHTTKKDMENHGFGLQNIHDVVKRYHGTICYQQITEDYIVCRVLLIKNDRLR